MIRELEPMDISNVPELLHLAEEVRATRSPRVLRSHDEDLAVLQPIANGRRQRTRRVKTEADYEAFAAAAGSWKDVDVEAF
ncbi:MAG: hypothetical protein ACYDAR_05090 [Thermomicrobiales bacterium]